MAKKLTPITEQYQQFVQELKESFWGDLYRGGQQALKQLLEAESERERHRYLMREAYERKAETTDYRNGSYERDVVTRLGTIRFRVARTRQRAFLPKAVKRLQRRAEDVAMLIREAPFARDFNTASEAGDWDGHRRSSQRTDGVNDQWELGRDGESVSPGRAGRRLGVSVSGRGEFTGEAARRALAGADAGDLWSG